MNEQSTESKHPEWSLEEKLVSARAEIRSLKLREKIVAMREANSDKIREQALSEAKGKGWFYCPKERMTTCDVRFETFQIMTSSTELNLFEHMCKECGFNIHKVDKSPSVDGKGKD